MRGPFRAAGGGRGWGGVGGVAVPYAATLSSGGVWTGLGSFGQGFDARVNALGVFDLGDGARLYAGGTFRMAGGVTAAGVARKGTGGWEGLATTILPANTGTIRSMQMFNDGTGMALYVAGAFN